MKQWLLLLTMTVALGWYGAGWASTWCGENGVVRFSFAEGDSLVTVIDTEAAEAGLTRVKVYCWLTDIVPLANDGEAFLHVGGFEFAVDVAGAEPAVISQVIPGENVINVGTEPGEFVVGFHPGNRIRDGRILLATFELLFTETPQDVRLGLDPHGTDSCATVPGCPDGETPALYLGNFGSNHATMFFAAGYEPAWINPTEPPDQTVFHGPQDWRDAGVFEERVFRR